MSATDRFVIGFVTSIIEAEDFMKALEAEMFAVLSQKKNDELDRQQQKSLADFYAHSIYYGSRCFVNTSRAAVDIANAIALPVDIVLWFAELPAWGKAVRFWGYTGDPKPLAYRPTSVPVVLREAYLIQEVFQKYCPIRFVTYDGFKDTRVKKVDRYDFLLDDDSRLAKHDVILAFPQDRMGYVKRGIKRRSRIAEQNLQPIKCRSERPKIEVTARIGDQIECVMRNGLVVVGENIWISKYNIVMRVGGRKGAGGKVVLLYQHALYNFKVLKNRSDPEFLFRDSFDDE